MIIRRQQIASLSKISAAKFEARTAEHLARCFPDECKGLGDDKLRELIRYGVEHAAKYGIDLERDVCKYIDLMVVFGRDFDTSADRPWASLILEDKSLANSTAKTERLFAEAKLQLTSQTLSEPA